MVISKHPKSENDLIGKGGTLYAGVFPECKPQQIVHSPLTCQQQRSNIKQ